MKIKFLVPMSLSIIISPTIVLVSCGNESLSQEERDEQINWVYQAAKDRVSPKPTDVDNVKNIGDINETHINKILNKDGQNLLFKILNFEIPLIGAKDTDVNVKVSSKLDESIYQTYSFKLSSAVSNIENIVPMNKLTFENKLNEVYFNDYTNEIRNDISIRIKETSSDLDISEKFIYPPSVESENIFSDSSKPQLTAFSSKLQNYIAPTIVDSLNAIAFQKNMKITNTELSIDANIKPTDMITNGKVSFTIEFDEDSKSVYTFEPFLVNTFSNNFSNLRNDLTILIKEKFKPDWLHEGQLPATPPATKVQNSLTPYLGIQFSKNFSEFDKEFIISFNPESGTDLIDETSKIYFSIFNKRYSNTLFEEYSIMVSEINGYKDGVINFDPSLTNRREESWN